MIKLSFLSNIRYKFNIAYNVEINIQKKYVGGYYKITEFLIRYTKKKLVVIFVKYI